MNINWNKHFINFYKWSAKGFAKDQRRDLFWNLDLTILGQKDFWHKNRSIKWGIWPPLKQFCARISGTKIDPLSKGTNRTMQWQIKGKEEKLLGWVPIENVFSLIRLQSSKIQFYSHFWRSITLHVNSSFSEKVTKI